MTKKLSLKKEFETEANHIEETILNDSVLKDLELSEPAERELALKIHEYEKNKPGNP